MRPSISITFLHVIILPFMLTTSKQSAFTFLFFHHNIRQMTLHCLACQVPAPHPSSPFFFRSTLIMTASVSMLASGTRVRGFKPGRSRWIFRASENSSACLPSEEKWKNLSHVPALRHVKEPSTSVNYECASKIPCIVLFFANRGVSCLCGAWRLWR
jgi:hypothetical protein